MLLCQLLQVDRSAAAAAAGVSHSLWTGHMRRDEPNGYLRDAPFVWVRLPRLLLGYTFRAAASGARTHRHVDRSPPPAWACLRIDGRVAAAERRGRRPQEQQAGRVRRLRRDATAPLEAAGKGLCRCRCHLFRRQLGCCLRYFGRPARWSATPTQASRSYSQQNGV